MLRELRKWPDVFVAIVAPIQGQPPQSRQLGQVHDGVSAE
jgi:hypothetical protein